MTHVYSMVQAMAKQPLTPSAPVPLQLSQAPVPEGVVGSSFTVHPCRMAGWSERANGGKRGAIGRGGACVTTGQAAGATPCIAGASCERDRRDRAVHGRSISRSGIVRFLTKTGGGIFACRALAGRAA